jgi:AcrR family transcriptional regulator
MAHDVRSVIVKASLRLFSAKGFHGTSMREIAAAAKISLPTIYYYFKDKTTLFEEVVADEFLQLHRRMQAGMEPHGTPAEIYSQAVITAKKLDAYDRKILAMAMKVGFGFDGTGKARAKILQWERQRYGENMSFLSKFKLNETVKDDLVALLVDVSEHLMQRIILLGEDIPDEVVRRRFELLFGIAQ